jgi:deoxyribodipyrimidine photo-lyase
MYENGLFIFHRDLRVIDNRALYLANTKCKNIYAIFIFTPEQVGNTNKYKSNNAIQFMIESLVDLDKEIKGMSTGKLHCFYGKSEKILPACITHLKIDYVCFNVDYSPYAKIRDEQVLRLCDQMKVPCEYAHDYCLHIPGSIVSSAGSPYQKFTPYYHASLKQKVDNPLPKKDISFSKTTKKFAPIITLEKAFEEFMSSSKNENMAVKGGRGNALLVLRDALRNQKHYSSTHNNLSTNTTMLSAYIKFGCLSIREVYKAFHGNTDLIRQLIWRDFYMNILYCFPYVLEKSMKPKYQKIKWHTNAKWFHAWTTGTTGFPIVDAGMRELNQTGYMHNRARLITSSFLVKLLLINWKEGERYFAKKLIDYDPASNNGNWQWISGGGADSQPYFRIFNPWLQTKEYDPECNYIKKWIPELENVPVKDILQWDVIHNHYNKVTTYHKPIVDYNTQKEKALQMYADIFH